MNCKVGVQKFILTNEPSLRILSAMIFEYTKAVKGSKRRGSAFREWGLLRSHRTLFDDVTLEPFF